MVNALRASVSHNNMLQSTAYRQPHPRPVLFNAMMQQRAFSNKDEEEYNKRFESMLGKQATPLTEAEKAEIEKQKIKKAQQEATQS